MGVQTMGSQGGGGGGGGGSGNGKQSQFQPLAWKNSMYSLTLDEVQNQLGDLGKLLTSMNLDELLKNVITTQKMLFYTFNSLCFKHFFVVVLHLYPNWHVKDLTMTSNHICGQFQYFDRFLDH